MKKAGVVMAATDARRFPRTPFHSVARYWCAADDEGSTAACRNLGRGGLSLTMGRYLRPGRFMMLEVADDYFVTFIYIPFSKRKSDSIYRTCRS